MDKELEIQMDKYGNVARLQRFPVAGRFQVALALSSNGEESLWFNEKLEFEQFIAALVAAKDEMWGA